MKRNKIVQVSVELIAFIISYKIADIISKILGIGVGKTFSVETILKVLIMAISFGILEFILFKIIDKYNENKKLD